MIDAGGVLTCYHDLVFQPDMKTAKQLNGSVIRFSRQEHALLLCFVRNPHRLITRAELLGVLQNGNGNLSERKIDYLINRLRKRLGDSARKSRFIETRYGDGYIWFADPVKPNVRSAFLLIGPIHAYVPGQDPPVGFPNLLAASISKALNENKEIIVSPEWHPDPMSRDNFEFTLEVSKHVDEGVKHIALVLRDGKSGKVINKFRKLFPVEDALECIDTLTQQIIYSLWKYEILIDLGPEASVMRDDRVKNWHEDAAHMLHASSMNIAASERSVMTALNKYGALIQSIHLSPLSEEEWNLQENEIEDLCLRALPDAHGNPRHLLAIAKMLRFIDRGYLELACRLTNEAFHGSTTFAAVFTLKGQIEANKGNIASAISYYDKAIDMVEPASSAHIHLLILKVFAWMADGNRDSAYNAVVELHSIAPVDRNMFGLLMLPPGAKRLCSAAENMLAGFTPDTGRNLTRYLFKAWAKQFQENEHKKNILQGLAYHLQRHHGTSVISKDVAEHFPRLLVG
ncbi:helix-turn-helix domain-containing protein [Paracoccus onubensis]|uniref:helix-turn-helix domain-containing protein n=1 Tax=Paracoccus onubensis TaxID=1675788 RepID=UPI00272F1B40|nr:helix-turn-helix domain-containing protein [Paracoccus onubensis]MDP0929867.1 helix-turn-helix domain-containing protein [Paracoccus onubensis]